MRKNFREYIILFLIWCIAFALRSNADISMLEHIIMAMVPAFILTVIIILVINNVVKNEPKVKEQMFNKPLFKACLQNGFERKEDFLIAMFRVYTIIVEYSSGYKRIISVGVLFDPYSFGHLLTEEELEKLRKNNIQDSMFVKQNHVWILNSLLYQFEYVFFQPSYEQIMSNADDLINILVQENLKPVTYDRMQLIASKTMK